MNQKNKPLTDAMSEPQSPEIVERLDQIEQRLKATRPQPPRFNAAAIQRLADVANEKTFVERPTNRKSRRVATRRRRQIVGRLLVLTGSWLCGAGVGALVMFVLLSRTAPATDVNSEVVHIDHETLSPVAHDPIAVKAAEGSVRSAPRFTMSIDPLGVTYSPFLMDGPMLHVRSYLRPDAERPREDLNDVERGRAETWTSVKPYEEPESPVSRRDLMREFIGESAGPIL
jgi:hypothetical protein